MATNLPGNYTARAAHDDFQTARRKAFITSIGSALLRQPNELLAFNEVERLLPIQGQVYRGMRAVPLAAIRGSVDRYHDFDRNFLPNQTYTKPRWESVDAAMITDVPLPAIELYQMGEVYFVKDGNHRVSVARERGAEFIDAEVIECITTVPLPADVSVPDLLRLAEYGHFLTQTNLDRLRPAACITFTALGRYDTLLEHISAHRWYLGINLNREIGWEEGVQSWYDTIYRPMIETIRELDILRDFPGRTEADLYLWIMDHRWYLVEETGADVGAQTAAISYEARYIPWSRRVLRWMMRLRARAAHPFILSGQLIARALASQPDSLSPDLTGADPARAPTPDVLPEA